MSYTSLNNPAPRLRLGRKLLRTLLLAWLLFAALYGFSQNSSPALFHQLEKTPVAKRADKAVVLYKDNFRNLNAQAAMRALDTLRDIARQLNDRPLECAVFICRADYYSVNKGFNTLSTSYHQQAIDFATEHDMPVEVGIYLHKKAYYYFVFSHNTEACQYFLDAYEKFREIGFQKVPDISMYLMEQANFFYRLKDWENAQSLLIQSLSYPQSNPRLSANINNSIGLIHRGNGQYKEALKYFNQSLAIAKAAKDSAWIGIATGNVGSVYFLQGYYDRALPLIVKDYNTSKKYADSVNAGLALLRITAINIEENNLAVAARQLDTVAALISNKRYQLNLVTQAELYKQRSLLYQKSGKLAQAIEYRKRYEATKDSLARRDNIAAVENVKLKWEVSNHRSQIAQLKENMKTGKFKRNAVIFILFLLAVIVILLFQRHRLKAAKDQQLLLAEKRRVDEELNNAARSLNQYTENLRKNNLLIEKFKAELAQLKQQSDKADSNHLEQLLNARLMTADAWDEFKRLFAQVHTGFFTKLRHNHPNLTDTDIRLLSLIKLGLSNREMSHMLGVTVEGIKKSKQRLRKKMNLDPENDLEQVVANL